ncbi:hypothetical protein CLOBOL_00449 [Enterocloster bolteae ATCC BAA-613]|uniref:Uncharacterized protein n=1 Tax=Enterocloster bolteae (strain ATCC BAA-613 / DSM 15670 / CCUG 46953 / JCM 12243 / WAL 16351) TaxID=411902 RepID=A8RHL8_ENTBW|nr:hypothetical protein CLOBOL_00449 [Enterocloster bolteae ATCC BAA-613]
MLRSLFAIWKHRAGYWAYWVYLADGLLFTRTVINGII